MFRIWMLLLIGVGGVVPALAVEPVAATYHVVSGPGEAQRESRFLLVRTDALVEVRDLQTEVVERWERDPGGRLFYSRVFTGPRKLIEFQPGDLAMAGIPGDWDRISTVTGRALLARLGERASEQLDGRAVETYRGNIDGVATSVAWLPGHDLPARVAREAGHGRFELRLTALEAGPAALARLTPREVLQSCEVIDFADLGDRQGDPVIERLIHESGFGLHEH